MRLSITSILESIIFISFSIIFLYLTIIYKGNKIDVNAKCIMPCIILIVLKSFFPYEFFFTITVKDENILPAIFEILEHKLQIGLTLNQLLIFIWIIVALLKFFILTWHQIKLEKVVCLFPKSNSAPLLEELLIKNGINKKIDLIEIPHLSTPALVGLKKTKIIIPSNIQQKDLYYVLLHEVEHYKQKDLLLITTLQLLCIIYWWNPMFYILRTVSQQFIEYRVDRVVCKNFTMGGKLSYLESILDIAKLRNKNTFNPTIGVGFYEKQIQIYRRFMFVLNKEEKSGHSLPICFFIMVLLSTLIIIEPYSIKLQDSQNTYNISNDSYFVEDNGIFDLYIDGDYFITVDSMDGFDNIDLIK